MLGPTNATTRRLTKDNKNLKTKALPLKRSAVRKFVLFSKEVYKDHPRWVAPIFRDQITFILKGPFHEIGEVQLFMAYRGNRPVARVSAHINRRHNEHYKTESGFFWLF